MYDFIVFGYYAAPIGRTFFPVQNPYASSMLSFMTFGAGFLMRPIGAVVLGAYIDRFGRRAGLLLTLPSMSAGTLTIACLPGYAQRGLIAPLLILFSRLLQGFSAGVELGGVSIYLAEIATPGRKGFYVNWQSASQQVAVMVAALIGIMMVAMTTVSFYLITAYTPTFGVAELRLTSVASLVVTLCVGISNFLWLPVMGAASDRFGRRPLLPAFTVLALLTAYPAVLGLIAALRLPRYTNDPAGQDSGRSERPPSGDRRKNLLA